MGQEIQLTIFDIFVSFCRIQKRPNGLCFFKKCQGVASLHKLINLLNYPIDQPSDKLNIVINRVRNDLKKDGCAIIRGFLSKEGVSELIKETTSVAHYAHRSSALTNAYFTADDPS